VPRTSQFLMLRTQNNSRMNLLFRLLQTYSFHRCF